MVPPRATTPAASARRCGSVPAVLHTGRDLGLHLDRSAPTFDTAHEGVWYSQSHVVAARTGIEGGRITHRNLTAGGAAHRTLDQRVTDVCALDLGRVVGADHPVTGIRIV